MHLIHALWYGPLHVTRMCVWCVYQFWEYELYKKTLNIKRRVSNIKRRVSKQRFNCEHTPLESDAQI